MNWTTTQGAIYEGGGRYRFRVWAPAAEQVEVALVSPRQRRVSMEGRERGYFEATLSDVEPGSLYFYRLNGDRERPDPASRSQPRGVHGPSQVTDPHFAWDDIDWSGLPLADYILYELHVGTFTREGTFDAVIPHLAGLKELGVTAVELMPVAQFPGERNWGYDGVFPYAAQNSYGGPEGIKRLVKACHAHGLALVLDVVYNHLGPEGNYLADFGPYFTDFYKTPWGPAINFDGPYCDEVRRYFIDNALYWQTEFHVDALRLDAVHAIPDFSARTFLEELVDETGRRAERLSRQFYLIAESHSNDVRLTNPRERGGYGLHAQWSDDFHHALHTLLTGERESYYQDYGELEHLAKAYREGFVYSGQYSPARRRRYGSPSCDTPAERFVVSLQNHDQVGNRMRGDRLSETLSQEELYLAAAAMLLSPYVPLLFMGEEYGETAPFQYFTSHGDAALVEAVRAGRREEFAEFGWQGEAPDPQDEQTFLRSKLDHGLARQGRHARLRDFYRELIRLRKSLPALARLNKEAQEVTQGQGVLCVRRRADGDEVCLLLNFNPSETPLTWPAPGGEWRKLLDSSALPWRDARPRLPDQFVADGAASLPVPGRAAALFRRAG